VISKEEPGMRQDSKAPDASVFRQLLQFADTELRGESLLESHPGIGETLGNSDRIETAAIFGAMLLDDRLQSNCIRLEALVHLAAAIGDGQTLATQKQLADCFNELDRGICGRMEDPAEDVFVSLATTSEGNFRVLEGIWETGTFYLQRILDIVESLPDEGSFSDLHQRVFALLKLSEAVCDRAGLARYSVGGTNPRPKIAPAFCSKAKRKIVFFDCDELAHFGLTKEDLDIFILDDRDLTHVLTVPITDSPLQRFPIIDDGDRIVLVLPTAVSFAIRAAVVDFLLAHGLHESLKINLAQQYAALFRNTKLLGSFHGAPIFFSDREELPIAEAIVEADEGRYLHFVFFTDTLDHFYETGLAGANPGPAQHFGLLETRIHAAIEHTKNTSGYRNGVTLLVHCGIGRGVLLPIPELEHKDWSIQYISASDLSTLSCSSRFNALKLWKALEGVRRITELGVQIHNHNGLLNLIAWIDANEGHLVSHCHVPIEFRDSQGGLFIAPNFVLDLRHSIAIENDVHGIPTVDGKIEVVRCVKDSFFPEDNDTSIYAVEHYSAENGLPFVHVSDRRSWWCHVVPSLDGVGDYDRWLMLTKWLPRIVRAIEPIFDRGLSDVVLLRVEFQQVANDRSIGPAPTRDEIERSCAVDVDVGGSKVAVYVGEEFDLGLSHPTNISERVLVSIVCSGFAQLAGTSLTEAHLSELEARIVESDDARQMHAFQARTYRDFVRNDLGRDLIRLDARDVADLRSGLAFRVESREKGRRSLRSKQQCTKLLNSIVRDLENDICRDLRLFDRASVIELLLRNHEKATVDRERWTRTARANLPAAHSASAWP